MLRLDSMNLLIMKIKVLEMIGRETTRNQIARGVTSFSRSTVYRSIDKMIEMGLLELTPTGKEAYEVKVTPEGKLFSDAMRGQSL